MIDLWLITWSSYEDMGWRFMKRSWPLCAATSEAARPSSRVLLMCSTLTWTSLAASQRLMKVLLNQSSYAGTKWTHWMIERLPLSQRPLYLSGPANENGAAAPDTPTAAAPMPAFLSRSRLLRRPSSFPGSSFTSVMQPLLSVRLAERSAGEPGDEPVEECVVDECQRNARDQDRGHDPGPVVEVAPDQLGRDADSQRAIRRARDEGDRVQELVQDEREREDDDREDPRERDGEDDPDERPEARAAVDEGGVLELLRDALEEPHQQPRRERDRERGIDEDQRPEPVAEVQVLRHHPGERQEEERRRHEVRQEDRDAHRATDSSRKPGERVARGDRHGQRDQDYDDADEARVLEPAPGARVVEEDA